MTGDVMVVLVCGGRDFYNAAAVNAALSELHRCRPFSLLVHGDARGADRLAGTWATRQRVEVVAVPADWQRHGKRAGVLRNAEMLAKHQPELVVAFPGGRGTAHMVSIARAAGVPVHEVVPAAQEPATLGYEDDAPLID